MLTFCNECIMYSRVIHKFVWIKSCAATGCPRCPRCGTWCPSRCSPSPGTARASWSCAPATTRCSWTQTTPPSPCPGSASPTSGWTSPTPGQKLSHMVIKNHFWLLLCWFGSRKKCISTVAQLQKFLSKDVSQIFYKSVLVIIFSFAFLYTKGGIY